MAHTLTVINRGLPNISTYIKVILKREKLSEEAESMRARYENLLTSLETGNNVPHRPVSIICDDDSGYFSGNRHPRGEQCVFYQLNFSTKRKSISFARGVVSCYMQ